MMRTFLSRRGLCCQSRWSEIAIVFFVVGILGYLSGVVLREKANGNSLQFPEKKYRRVDGGNSEMDSALQKGSEHHQTEPPEFVSALNKTWLTWDSIDSPGTYRACVKRPEEGNMQTTLTGGRVIMDRSTEMKIEDCLEACIQLTFTYAALSRGSECFCTDVTSSSSFLTYVGNGHCDLPCTGDPLHNCGGQEFMSVYRTSVPDARCSLIKLGSPGSFPLLALASFPRSGNTWTRQLIEKATGYYTGSIYWSAEKLMEISKKVFPGGNIEYKKRQTICIKSHKHGDRHMQEFEGAILIIRNPYRTIVAEVFRKILFESNETPEKAMKYFKSKEWEGYVEKSINEWKVMNLQWMRSQKNFHLVIYEELERDTVTQLTRIAEFLLNGKVKRERIICATQDHPSSLVTGTALGNHGLRTRVYLKKDPFSPKMHSKIDESIRSVNETLFKYHNVILPREYVEAADVF